MLKWLIQHSPALQVWITGHYRKEIRQFHRDVGDFKRQLADHERRRRANERALTERKNELTVLHQAITTAEERLQVTIEEAKKLHLDDRNLLESYATKLKILEEVTVPTLVQANEVFLERFKAETDIQIMRQVATRPNQSLEE